MSENEKYFIPEIQDIFIGYECELFYQSDNKLAVTKNNRWHLEKIDQNNFQRLSKLLKEAKVRTAFLTKEQIEKEGWESFGDIEFKRNGYQMVIRLDKTIGMWETWNGETIYNGKCPSINEFRKICKLIGCE